MSKLKEKIGKAAAFLKGRFSKKQLIFAGIGAAVLVIIIIAVVSSMSGGEEKTEYEMVTVERRDITKTIDGSSVIEANDTYNVTALVTGEILSDTFNEGDIIKKDTLLYTIDSSETQKKVDSAENSLAKAQQAFEDAVKKKADTVKTNSNTEKTTKESVTKALSAVESAKRTLNTAQSDVDDLTIKANHTGTVGEVLVKVGDSVGSGTKLARVYNDKKLKIQIPFNDADAQAIYAGSDAELTVSSSGDKLRGKVESVAGATTATAAHAIVRYVTVVCDNPGGLSAGEKAAAVINGVSCSTMGVFENYDDEYITAKASGTLNSLNISQNDYVKTGQVIGYIESDNAENTLKNAQSSLQSAQIDLNQAYRKLEQLVVDNDTYSLDTSISNAKIDVDNARLSLETAQDNLDDYEIKAPIDGTIVQKNKKAGDKLEQNTNSSSEPMAIIYDMSVLTVQLSVDETDIHYISVGQPVMITADAVEGMFHGEVTKVGINGSSENGVTVYPVDITISDYGELLPGMNVDCVIEAESAKNVLAVPAEAIQRGGVVYIRGDKTEDRDRAPDGFCSVRVETGVTDSTFIEIKNGLEEGMEICGSIKPSGVEAEGMAQFNQQQMRGGMGGMRGGMGGPPGGGMR